MFMALIPFLKLQTHFLMGILICGIYSYMEAEKLNVCLDLSVLAFFWCCVRCHRAFISQQLLREKGQLLWRHWAI